LFGGGPIFTLYTLIVKPLIFLLILGAFGSKHAIFQTRQSIYPKYRIFAGNIIAFGSEHASCSTATMLSVMAAVAVLSVLFSSILISYSRYGRTGLLRA